MSNPYPAEFRDRALRMLADAQGDHASDFAAANRDSLFELIINPTNDSFARRGLLQG